MRTNALLIILIFSISSYGQKHWKIEDNALKWAKVTEFESKPDAIHTWLSTLKDVTDVNKTSDDVIVFKLINHQIDLKQLDQPISNTPTVLNFPISSDGLIQFKEGRFRILLTNMTLHNDLGKFDNDFSNFLLKKDFSDFRKSGTATKSLNIYNKFFDNFFTFKPIDNDW